MDIEGAEIDALEGALETIPTQQPILAVSAYHRQEHILGDTPSHPLHRPRLPILPASLP